MAGDWIKFEHATPDKPEVFRMSSILKIDPDAVIGKLARFWCWCDQQTVDGNSLGIDDTVIDRVTHQPGFSAALREVAWLQARSGSLAIPHFDRHNGHSAKARALAHKRQLSLRERDKNVTRDSSVSSSVSSPPVIGESIPLPDVLMTEAFKAKWAEYVAYRRAGRMKPLKPISVQKQWAEMATWGHDASIESIETTIRKGWQGLFQPDGKSNNANHRPSSNRGFSGQPTYDGVTDK